jgi:hypothetical protein
MMISAMVVADEDDDDDDDRRAADADADADDDDDDDDDDEEPSGRVPSAFACGCGVKHQALFVRLRRDFTEPPCFAPGGATRSPPLRVTILRAGERLSPFRAGLCVFDSRAEFSHAKG